MVLMTTKTCEFGGERRENKTTDRLSFLLISIFINHSRGVERACTHWCKEVGIQFYNRLFVFIGNVTNKRIYPIERMMSGPSSSPRERLRFDACSRVARLLDMSRVPG
jgi:hypothetical protein